MSKLKMTVSAFMMICFQLGITILAWGGFRAYFSHPPLTALAILTLVFTVVALFSPGNVSSGKQEDRSNRWVITAISVISILMAFFPAYTDRMNFFVFDGDTLRWAGVALMAVGSTLRVWPVFVLGRRFSGLVAIQEGHTLVTTGIYGKVRNPSYLGLLIASLGWALAFRSGVGVLLAAALIPPLVSRMNAEEKLLHGYFGDKYNAYRARTARLIPRIY